MHFAFPLFSMLKYHHQKLLHIINSTALPTFTFLIFQHFFRTKNKWLGTAWFIILEKVNLSCLKSGVSPLARSTQADLTQKQLDFLCMVCQFIPHFGQYSVNLIRNVKSVSIISFFLYLIFNIKTSCNTVLATGQKTRQKCYLKSNLCQLTNMKYRMEDELEGNRNGPEMDLDLSLTQLENSKSKKKQNCSCTLANWTYRIGFNSFTE